MNYSLVSRMLFTLLTPRLPILRNYSDTTENAELIANLSSVIRDNIIRSHDRFQQITKDLLWLNLTVYGQSELFTMIRQLEFSILQLTQRLELTNAIQYVVMGS